MCDIGEAMRRAFTPPGTGALMAGFEGQQKQATDASTAAEKALGDAIAGAKTAALPVLDNPAALAAQQAEMRKRLAQQGSAWSFGNTPGAAPTAATKVLFGS